MSGIRSIRVLVAKPGLDGHDRGAKVIALALRDAGFEVIYTGIRQTPEQIVEAAVQEDVDAVGISILSGAHMVLLPRIKEMMDQRTDKKILFFAGGVISEEDASKLKSMGYAEVFGPGSASSKIVDFLSAAYKRTGAR